MTTLLVIEDEKSILNNIVEMLELYEFNVLCASDGEAGIQLAQEHLPDLIICDIMMPKVDGYQVLLAVRSEPSTATTPFVFLTAKADRNAQRYGMEIGADDYITKPFTADELVTAVRTRLERQQRLVQEHEQKMEALRGSVFHMLPHELRTPLTGILGYSELLMMDAPVLSSEQVAEMSGHINKAGMRLLRLVENFLLFAQLEAMSGHPERLERMAALELEQPDQLIVEVARIQADRANRPDDLELAVSHIPFICGTDDNLRKVLREVLDNAFKFSHENTPVSVTAGTKNGWYAIEVSNFGRGMTREQIANIGAYRQFDRQLYEQQGTGLGLVLARRLTELHNGHLSIDSTPDEQTTVTINMPLPE